MIRGIVKSVWEGMIKRFSASGRPGETIANREYFQHYGFTSRPLPGAEIIIIREGNHFVSIASDDRRYRVAVEAGEVAIYTDEGDKVHFKRGKNIEVVCGNKLKATVANEVEVFTKTAIINASVGVQVASPSILLGSQGTTYALVDQRLLNLYNNHSHGIDGTPVAKLSLGNVCTSITKAG
jgi:phage gp45-like